MCSVTPSSEVWTDTQTDRQGISRQTGRKQTDRSSVVRKGKKNKHITVSDDFVKELCLTFVFVYVCVHVYICVH